jgi:hypothetical protein
MKKPLLFIDTNIFLDFYRATGRDGKLSILGLINDNHGRIITGEQVEMEYKKNRQHVIEKEAMRGLNQSPTDCRSGIPKFLAEAKATEMITKNQENIKTQLKRIKARLERVLFDPTNHDTVYQCLQRLFQADSEYHLTASPSKEDVRNRILRLARRRFMMGYPPRKSNDTSYGDAINWEWTIHCAKESKSDIIIVSRDTDYGTTLNDKSTLNDWLRHEFAKRVTKTRKVLLMDRLTDAFKHAAITVTKEQVAEEESMVSAKTQDQRWQVYVEGDRDNLLTVMGILSTRFEAKHVVIDEAGEDSFCVEFSIPKSRNLGQDVLPVLEKFGLTIAGYPYRRSQ